MYSNYFNPFNYEFYRQPNNSQLTKDIQKAINGEYSAILCYEKLAKKAPTQAEKNTIIEIQNDEKRHLDEFRKIYTNLTGKQASLKVIEECPDLYKDGLVAAFKDEQETVDFYLDISDKSTDIYTKEIFRRAAADEQNHAVWFLYFSK